jgi:hypothetical protein
MTRIFAAVVSMTFALAATADAQLAIKATTFGWDPVTQQTTAGGVGPLAQYPALGPNQQLEIEFNGNLTASSIKGTTAYVESVPATELQALGLTSTLPGGLVAPVNFKVKGDRLLLQPAVLVSNGIVSFGFVSGAFYRLKLVGGGKGIKGSPGNLSKTINIRFRTTSTITDPQPGAPKATVVLVDKVKGSKTLPLTTHPQIKIGFDKASASPSPVIRILFNEIVQPLSVIDAATQGSPAVTVETDADGTGLTTNDRFNIPGVFELITNQKKSTLIFTPTLGVIPGDTIYVISIAPTVVDIVGNSEQSLSNEFPDDKNAAFKTAVLNVPPDLPDIVEEFEGQAQLDLDGSSADWGLTIPGSLINGPGGGTGEDGPFVAASSEVILSTETTDPDTMEIVPRIYNFTEFNVASGVTVRGVGRFPLQINCTGPVVVSGDLDVSGAAGEVIEPTQVIPGLGGEAAAGGTAGGLGGSVTFGLSDVAGVADFTPTITNVGFEGYVNAASIPIRGLSGQVTSHTDFAFTANLGSHLPPSLFTPEVISELMVGATVQPNVGTGSNPAVFPNSTPGSAIQHNHPNFVIETFSTPGSFGVVDTAGEAGYAGSLNQPGLDVYELPPPPIVRDGDPVVFGDLAGHSGSGVGFLESGGAGSEPLTVAQSFITQVRSGGGGGGGGRLAGDPGEDSPTFGFATGTAGGAGGLGAATGTVSGFTATTLSSTGTPFAGLTLGPGVDPLAEPPATLFPDLAGTQYFEIASNTANQITIVPIDLPVPTPADTNSDGTLDLLDVVSLAPGATYRIEPSLRQGGGGGGGSGVHLANTAKSSPSPNLQLPSWTPGVGGGGGGGSVIIEAADKIAVPLGGRILANGGEGGRTSGFVGQSASGGGGGGGGTVVLRSTDPTTFAVSVEGLVDAGGGAGGFGFVEGGQGGGGRSRFESIAGNLVLAQFLGGKVVPDPAASDLGIFIPGLGATVALSKFYFSGALIADYTDFIVEYSANVDGVPTTGLTFTRADLLASEETPIAIEFNDASIAANGDVDPATIDFDFVADPALLNQSFIRFRIVIEAAIEIDGATYTNVQIDSVTIKAKAG